MIVHCYVWLPKGKLREETCWTASREKSFFWWAILPFTKIHMDLTEWWWFQTSISLPKMRIIPIGSMYGIYYIWGILMGSMIPYIAAPWILWDMFQSQQFPWCSLDAVDWGCNLRWIDKLTAVSCAICSRRGLFGWSIYTMRGPRLR